MHVVLWSGTGAKGHYEGVFSLKGSLECPKSLNCLQSLEIGGKKFFTKGVFSSENSSASTGKREVWCIPKSLFSREKEENTYTPKSLQGVCGGPLRAVLVYRFWPPIENGQTLLVFTHAGNSPESLEHCKCPESLESMIVFMKPLVETAHFPTWVGLAGQGIDGCSVKSLWFC